MPLVQAGAGSGGRPQPASSCLRSTWVCWVAAWAAACLTTDTSLSCVTPLQLDLLSLLLGDRRSVTAVGDVSVLLVRRT